MRHTDKKRCFSEFELGAYMEGRLSQEERDALDERLAACTSCWNEFVAINRAIIQKDELADENVPEYLITRAVGMFPEKHGLFDLVVNIVKDSVKLLSCSEGFHLSPPLPAAAVRGSKAMRPEMIVLKKSFQEIDVELDIEKVAGDQCNIRVAVNDVKAKVLTDTLRVELISKGRELVSSLIEDGETVMEDIGTGHYVIKIHKKGKVFGEIALKIK